MTFFPDLLYQFLTAFRNGTDILILIASGNHVPDDLHRLPGSSDLFSDLLSNMLPDLLSNLLSNLLSDTPFLCPADPSMPYTYHISPLLLSSIVT